jgi:hypothetical protein
MLVAKLPIVQVVKITWPKFLLQLREALALDSRIELDESDMMAMQTVYLHEKMKVLIAEWL